MVSFSDIYTRHKGNRRVQKSEEASTKDEQASEVGEASIREDVPTRVVLAVATRVRIVQKVVWLWVIR